MSNAYEIEGLLKKNYYNQAYDGEKPQSFSTVVQADSAADAAEYVRRVYLNHTNLLAVIRTVIKVPKFGERSEIVQKSMDADRFDWSGNWKDQPWVAIDTETTGLNPKEANVTEVGWCFVNPKTGKVSEPSYQLINPGESIPQKIVELTGITDDMVADEPTFGEFAPKLRDIIEGRPLMAHNRGFDVRMIQQELQDAQAGWLVGPSICTLAMAVHLNYPPGGQNNKLETICEHIGYAHDQAHRAGDDARGCAKAFLAMQDEHGLFDEDATLFDVVQFFDQVKWPGDPK